MNIGVQISLQDSIFNSFVCIPRNGIAGSDGSSALKFYLFIWLHLVFTAVCGLSLVVASGSFFSCSVRASHYDGFSCCRVQSPGMGASVLVYTGLVAPQHLYTGLVAPQHVYTGLVAPQHVESSQTGVQS